ncbi:MAG: hypothetical protein KGD64_00815 [Candidatus Heimdallarchaeota archaeon]|nr:hypothetical protein [Candidatus Heimdallarchaeota archaeon]
MSIIFRCNNCETINDIPNNHQYRLCKDCGKLITYTPGEAIIVDDIEIGHNVFLQSGKLSTSEAEKFFQITDTHKQKISDIITAFEKKSAILFDIQSTNLPDTVLSILKQSKTQSLDELIRNCRLFDISLPKLEAIILQLKKEGYAYQPKSWLILLA